MDLPFDVSDLPTAFREQLHSLQDGDEIVLIEEGEVVGTVVASPRVVVGQVLTPASADPQGREPSRPGPKVVATGMKVTEHVRAYLSAALGDEYAVVDIRKAPETIDALLVPPLGAQAQGILRGEFPSARLIVAEFDDPESATRFAGPVSRAMAAGADAYLTPETLGDLATEVRVIMGGRGGRALPSGSRQSPGVSELEG